MLHRLVTTFDLIFFDKAYLALFVITIILTYLITIHFYDKMLAIFICYCINKRLNNAIIIKFDSINVSLVFFCLKIYNLKIFVKNIGYCEVNEVFINVNIFKKIDSKHSTFFFVRFDCVNIFVKNDKISIKHSLPVSPQLLLIFYFILNNSIFDLWHTNISICYDKSLNLFCILCLKQLLFVYKNFENDMSSLRFQAFNSEIYLKQDKLKRSNEFSDLFNRTRLIQDKNSYSLILLKELNGNFNYNFKGSVKDYKAKLLKISSDTEEAVFNKIVGFVSLKTTLDLQLNIDFWNNLIQTLPLLIGFIKNTISKSSIVNNQNPTIIFHFDLGFFDINIVNANNLLFKFRFGGNKSNSKLEFIQSFSIHDTNRTKINLQVYYFQIHSFLNRHPLLSTTKEFCLYFDYKFRKVELHLKLNNEYKEQNLSETNFYLYNLQENLNLAELCILKFKHVRTLLYYSSNHESLKRSTPFDHIRAVNLLCVCETLVVNFLIKPTGVSSSKFYIKISNLNINCLYPYQQPNLEHLTGKEIAILALFNNLILMTPIDFFQVKFERLVIERFIALTEVKTQLLFSPMVLLKPVNSDKNFTAKKRHNNAKEAIYVSVLQIRNHKFYNNNICYSTQTELIVGDIFGTLSYDNFLKLINIINLMTNYVVQEMSARTFIYEIIFKDAEVINTKKLIYKSFRFHSSICHVNLLQNLMPNFKLIGLNFILSPICFASCDLHCQNGQPGYLGYLNDVFIRILSSNSQHDDSWVEVGLFSYHYLSIYRCFQSANNLNDIENRGLQINFLIKNDEISKRLHVFWDNLNVVSVSQLTLISVTNQSAHEINNFKFTTCACTGHASFFSKSFDKTKFYSTENGIKLKPAIYVRMIKNFSGMFSFGESILIPNIHAFYSYLYLKSSKKPTFQNLKFNNSQKDVYKLSFDEGNNFKIEKKRIINENEHPIADIIITPPPLNKKFDEFSLYIEYLPIIKNISNIDYDPQKEVYFPYSNLKNQSNETQSYPQSSSLKAIQHSINLDLYFEWLQQEKTFDEIKDEYESKITSLSSQTTSSEPLSLSILSIGSLLTGMSTTVSENTSLHSNITPVYVNSLDTNGLNNQDETFKTKKKRLPASEIVLKLANHPKYESYGQLDIFHQFDRAYKNKLWKPTVNISIKKIKRLKPKFLITKDLNTNNNNNNNNNNNKAETISIVNNGYFKLLSNLNFSSNQNYPLINFDCFPNKRVSFDDRIIEIILNTFEYADNGEKNLKMSIQQSSDVLKESSINKKTFNYDNKSTILLVISSNQIITPLALETIKELLKETKNLIPQPRITEKIIFNFEQICLNILWTSSQTIIKPSESEMELTTSKVSSNHLLNIKLLAVQIFDTKDIHVENFIVDSSKQFGRMEKNYGINIKESMKEFASILFDFNTSFDRVNFLFKLLINKTSIVNTQEIINLPGVSIIPKLVNELIDINIKLENWNIEQSIPANYMMKTASIIFNFCRYFNLYKPNGFNFKYKLTLSITNLMFKLYKNITTLEINKYLVIKFSTKSFKFCTSNSFEIKKLLFRLLTTIKINILVYDDAIMNSSSTIRVKTVGSNVNSIDSTNELVSISDESIDFKNKILLKKIKILLRLDKRVLDCSIKLSIKDLMAPLDNEDYDYYIMVIFQLIIESSFKYINENEYKLKLPGILSYISSKNEIMHVFELIETSFDCNDLERKLKFIVSKSRIMNSKSVINTLEYFKKNFFNFFEYENNEKTIATSSYQLLDILSYKFELTHGELCYSYFLNKLSDKEWFYFKLYEFEIEYKNFNYIRKSLKLSIEYCKNAIKQQLREIDHLLNNLTNPNTNSSVKKLNNNEFYKNFQLKNSSFLYVTSKYDLPLEKFDFNDWLSYACIDSEHTYGYTIKVVALFPTLHVFYRLKNEIIKDIEWDLEAFFEHNMFIDAKLIQDLWTKFRNTLEYFHSNNHYKMAKFQLNNLNLADFNTGQRLHGFEELLRNNFSNQEQANFLNFCLIQPFNIVYNIIHVFN